MPIYQLHNKLVYCAHIPKTAGTSVGQLMVGAGATQHFVDNLAHKEPKSARFVNLPPQHMPRQHFETLFDMRGFAASFGFSRHPEDRLISEYRFRYERGGIHPKLSFSDWVIFIFAAYQRFPYLLEGHILPQHAFVLPGMKTFKLEDGLEPFIGWISKVVGVDFPSDAASEHHNASIDCEVVITRECRALINSFYQKDFKEFGYTPRDPTACPSDSGAIFKRPLLNLIGALYAYIRR